MIAFNLEHLVKVLDAQLKSETLVDDIQIEQVTTDTRAIEKGSLFIALIGESFDGHQFAQEAQRLGASALVVSKPVDVSIPQLIVSDTLVALGKLGAWIHQKAHQKAMTFALTGSCGKTSVKEMLTSILSLKGDVLATAGNFNNEIGVPLTLLRSQLKDQYAVIELGANHQGEIAYTTCLVEPDVALVNNIAAAHLEGFGSIDGVAKAKGEIFEGLKPGQTAIINLDSQGDELWQAVLADKKVITISLKNDHADFYARNIQIDMNGFSRFELHTPSGKIDIHLALMGQHNIANAIAASAMAMQAGASLEQIEVGLAKARSVKGRVYSTMLTPNVRLIDDSYNASVPAMKAAIDLLANYGQQRWLILGFMAELGEQSLALHREVGEYAAKENFEHVLTYGDDTKVISQLCQGVHFKTHQDMMLYIKQHLDINTTNTLLIKGANSSKMSQIVTALQENYA